MAVEARRGCGYRKVGGLYLMGGTGGFPCCKMPIALKVCPTCGGGVKQTRGWTWIDPRPWLQGECLSASPLQGCPAADPEKLGSKVGLLWIGAGFYRTPEEFAEEARVHGISRRIAAVPKDFKLGESWVMLAHPKVVRIENEWAPGIFRIFKPSAIEKIVTESDFADEQAMEKLRKAGITPIAVPDDDKDHQGSVYDDDAAETELPLRPGTE